MLDLSVLMGLTPSIPEGKKTERTKESIKGDFRILKSGAIVLSEEFAKELKENNKFVDIADGTQMCWSDGKAPEIMFACLVDNTLPKASFQFKWTEEDPNQTKFILAFVNKYFKQMANKLYSLNWETAPYVDFTLLRDKGIATKFAYIPRTSSKTGREESVKREDVVLYPVVPSEALQNAPVVEKPKEVQMEIPFETTVS